jgi:hypothetical protein
VGADCRQQVTQLLANGLAGAHTALNDVQGIPVTFVGRYLGPHHVFALNANEIQTLSGANLRIVTLSQPVRTVQNPTRDIGMSDTTAAADRIFFMQNFGMQHGAEAFNAALAFNQEPHTPIFFSVDYDFRACWAAGKTGAAAVFY